MRRHLSIFVAILAFWALRPQPHPTPRQARDELFRLCLDNQKAYQACLDNLAHQFTPGYRASEVLNSIPSPRGPRFPLRMDQGPFRETRDPYALAIDGNGFFLLNDGTLTRDGRWVFRQNRLCAEGNPDLYLVDANGQPLTIPDDFVCITIEGDGALMGCQLNGDGKPQLLGNIRLAKVANPQWLERVQNRLRLTPESGPILSVDKPGQNGMGVIAQGFLELSNVNPLEQLETAQALRRYAGLLGDPMIGSSEITPPIDRPSALEKSP